ncbi:MAG: FkbM family methyltransferase [Acidimicrobiales bacterium]
MRPLRAPVTGALAVLGRHYPLCRGHGWLARNVFPLPGERSGSTEVRLRCGPRVLVHCDDFIGRIVFYFGDLDPRISWVCKRILRSGDVVVDVGANYGVITLLAADLVGERGLVHAFEPQPLVAALLRKSLERNGFNNAHVHQVALSEADGELKLHVPAGHLGGASLDRFEGPGSSINVKVRDGSAALAALDLPAIRLLKADIEGHEAAFLRGSRVFLRRCPPDVILFESNDALYESGESAPFWEREAVRELGELEYEMFRVSQRLGALRPKLVRVKPGGDDPGLDFVAMHRSKHAELAGLLDLA